MNINDKFILLIIFLSTISVLIKSIFYDSPEKKGLIITTLLILSIVTATILIHPYLASIIGSITWIILLLLPNWGFTAIKNAVYKNNFARARQWIRWMRCFYPFFHWQEYCDIVDINELARHGQLEQATAIFNRYQASHTQSGMLLVAQFYRFNWQWEQCLQWINTHFPDEKSQKKSLYLPFIAYYIRALGETGQLEDMLACYQRHQKRLNTPSLKEVNAVSRLFIFAFYGKITAVKQLLQQSALKSLSQEHQLFWCATAQQAAGQWEEAQHHLQQLSHHEDATIRNTALRRLNQPLQPSTILSTTVQQSLAQISLEIEQEQQFSLNTNFTAKKIYVTYLLIVTNLIAFALEMIFGGSQNLQVLYEMGSLIPIFVWEDGQWWRIVSSTFLHYGHIHLMFNMLTLLLLGIFVETRLKMFKFLLIYFSAGIGANLVFLLIQPHNDLTTVVGASGAVMGLLGSMGALLLQGWRTQKAQVARRSLTTIIIAIILQTIIDLSMSEISFTHHISGIVIGFTVTMLLLSTNKNADRK